MEKKVDFDTANRTSNHKYGVGDDIRQKFTGYEKDEETQLDFAEARMYQNKHGRFTAVDPLLTSGKSANPQTFNRYVYVLNNPLIFTDPDGLQVSFIPTGGEPVVRDGRWYQPMKPDGKKPYRFESESPPDYEPVTTRNWQGDLVGNYVGGMRNDEAWSVLRFNEMGPMRPLPTTDLRNGQTSMAYLTDFERNGFERIMGPDYRSTGAVTDVSLETFTAATGVCSLARAGASAAVARSFATQEGGAVFYTGGARAALAAEQFAVNSGRQTITMTPGGRALNTITNLHAGNFSIRNTLPSLNTRLWSFGSRQFAQGASGNVNVFRTFPTRPGNLFETVEQPILQQSQNVLLQYRRVQSCITP